MEINDSGKVYYSPLDLFSYDSQLTIERITSRFEVRMWSDRTNYLVVMLIDDKQAKALVDHINARLCMCHEFETTVGKTDYSTELDKVIETEMKHKPKDIMK